MDANVLRPAADRLRELADQHGTPLYVLSMDVALERLAALSGFDRVRYAAKAYGNVSFLRRLRDEPIALDVVSAGEVRRALAAGWPTERIVLTSDVLDPAAEELVREHGIHVNAGSAFMLEVVARATPGAELTLRVNPGFGDGHDFKVVTGGTCSKHGIWHEDLADVIARARSLGLVPAGLHAHIGSGATEQGFAKLRAFLPRAAELFGPDLRTLSTGGGLPIPYVEGAPRFDVAAHAAAWQEAVRELRASLPHELTLEIEPGRWIVAEAGLLVTRVLGVKRQGDERYALCDAGFHTLARPLLYGARHRMSVLDRDDEPTLPTHVAGPLCETGDELGRGETKAPAAVPLARGVCAGDLLVVRDVGAYGASMASNYNAQPLPAEVLVEGDHARLVRARQSFEHLLAPELPPLAERGR